MAVLPRERVETSFQHRLPFTPPGGSLPPGVLGPEEGAEWTTSACLTRGREECPSAREDAPGTPKGTSDPTAPLSGGGGWVRHPGSRIPTPHRPRFTEGEAEDRLSQVGGRALPAGGAGGTQATDSAPVWCRGRTCHSQRTPFSVSPVCVTGAAGRDFSRHGAWGRASRRTKDERPRGRLTCPVLGQQRLRPSSWGSASAKFCPLAGYQP